ncbi:DUF3352 domain-containing protein [Chloracidobacterium sp. MS 40/45]|uniref:DUF3352 domain-containing protein n=1 Tax=Chloracidobacterium aggregatum TaxID=2851959 RepID=UPI001B8C5160|nr:DUF3352 domain-containing protein [Chloracidobacterium aggregatum]QUW00473.1 DUF3352 domain-containing protein [Chloracidobacterium sp. MS 40/45]
MNFSLCHVFPWTHRFRQTCTIFRSLLAGGLLLTLILSNWNLAEAQRARRQPARKAPATTPPSPSTAPETTAPRPLAEYFPASALLYAEFERLPNAVDEVLAVDSLKQFLAASDSPLPIDLTRYDEALTAVGFPDKATLAATRIGFGLMLSPNPKKSTVGGLFPTPEVEFVVVLIAPDDAAAARFVQLGEQWLPTLVTNTRRVKPLPGRAGRFRTTTFPAAKATESLVMAHSGQVIAVGFRPVMTRWLTQMTQPTFSPLGKARGFEDVQKQLTDSRNGMVYINTSTIGTYVRDLFAELLKPSPSGKRVSREQARAEAEFAAKINQLVTQSGIGAVDGAGYAYGVKNGRVTQRIVVGLDRASEGLFPAFADGLRVSGRAADFLPDDTQIFATLSVNPTRVYDTLRQMAGTFNARYETDIQVAERKFGVNFRQEIAAALTGEITMAVGGLQIRESVSNNMFTDNLRVATFAVSNNPQALREAFARIFSAAARKAADRKAWQAIAKPPEGTLPRPIFDPRTKTHEGETIWLFEGSNDDEENAFAVSVVANVLVAGRTSDVKWVIDTYRRGQTLGRREDFNVGFGARPADAMGSAYVSQGLLAQALNELRNETPKRYQMFLEGLTPFPLFTHIGREGRVITNTVDLSLPYLVGIAGAGWGASSAADERRANEQGVREVLRMIYQAQMEYAGGDGKGNYSDSLPTLAKRADGSRNFGEEVELMTRLPYRGYVLGPIVLRPAEGDRPAGFHVTAFPAVRTGPDRTGDQTFYLDETGMLRCLPASAGDANAESPGCDSFANEAPPDMFKP